MFGRNKSPETNLKNRRNPTSPRDNTCQSLGLIFPCTSGMFDGGKYDGSKKNGDQKWGFESHGIEYAARALEKLQMGWISWIHVKIDIPGESPNLRRYLEDRPI